MRASHWRAHWPAFDLTAPRRRATVPKKMSATALADLECRLQADHRARYMAKKYVWWQPPERTLHDGRLLLAQLMTLGTADDVRWLVSVASGDDLLRVLDDPPVGVFNHRSWAFWHLRLGREPVPDLPVRRLPS